MTLNCLKLTTYFGERQRHGGGFLSDVLLDFYADRQVATSILLRGVAGFGPHHNLRSDQSLSLSEDPPVAVVAIDTAERINALVDPLIAMQERGILTLERATLRRGGDDATAVSAGQTNKLTVYVGRKDRIGRAPAYIAICELLHRHAVAGASVFLGMDGTRSGTRTRARFFSRNADVPVMIVAVGDGERIDRALRELDEQPCKPIVTVERVQVCKRDGVLFQRPHALPGVDEHGLPIWQKLMVYTSESALYEGQPIHRALVQRLSHQHASHGATALRGIWGFHGDHNPHGDKLFQLTRRVPVATVIVDTPDQIAATFDVVDEVTDGQGLVTCEMVPAHLAVDGGKHRGGTGLARHDY